MQHTRNSQDPVLRRPSLQGSWGYIFNCGGLLRTTPAGSAKQRGPEAGLVFLIDQPETLLPYPETFP